MLRGPILVFISALLPGGVVQGAEPLAFSARLYRESQGDQPRYQVWEPIGVVLSVRNTGDAPVRILTPTLAPVSSLSLYVTAPDGTRKRVPLLADHADAAPRADQLRELTSGAEAAETLDLSLVCPLDKPGEYAIEVAYVGATASSRREYWRGRILAPTITCIIERPAQEDAAHATSVAAARVGFRAGDSSALLDVCRRLAAAWGRADAQSVLAYYIGRSLWQAEQAAEAADYYQRAIQEGGASDAAFLAKHYLSGLKQAPTQKAGR